MGRHQAASEDELRLASETAECAYVALELNDELLTLERLDRKRRQLEHERAALLSLPSVGPIAPRRRRPWRRRRSRTPTPEPEFALGGADRRGGAPLGRNTPLTRLCGCSRCRQSVRLAPREAPAEQASAATCPDRRPVRLVRASAQLRTGTSSFLGRCVDRLRPPPLSVGTGRVRVLPKSGSSRVGERAGRSIPDRSGPVRSGPVRNDLFRTSGTNHMSPRHQVDVPDSPVEGFWNTR